MAKGWDFHEKREIAFEDGEKVRYRLRDICVEPGASVSLKKDFDPGFTNGFSGKAAATAHVEANRDRLASLQENLYAQDTYALLVIFQAMDAAGKDSAIRHVMSGVNPQGCHVTSFKAPSAEELDHDYLWRAHKAMPARGTIGIFNRSYYEEVLVVRVHEEILARQKLPPETHGKRIWDERYEDINAFERYLTRNGIVILKFFLNVSKAEQKKRFLERIDEPEKNWKFSIGDVRERARWKDYQKAYEKMLEATSTEHAPWFVIPADDKWFARLLISETIAMSLEQLDLGNPQIGKERKRELQIARDELMTE